MGIIANFRSKRGLDCVRDNGSEVPADAERYSGLKLEKSYKILYVMEESIVARTNPKPQGGTLHGK